MLKAREDRGQYVRRTRASFLKNLLSRRRSRVQAKQTRPPRYLSEETTHAKENQLSEDVKMRLVCHRFPARSHHFYRFLLSDALASRRISLGSSERRLHLAATLRNKRFFGIATCIGRCLRASCAMGLERSVSALCNLLLF